MTDYQKVQDKKEYKYKENDPDYKGEDVHEDLASGPLEKRGCTDVLCLLLFIAFVAGMIFTSIVAFKNGNPKNLVSPYDSTGNHCGISKGFENYRYVYYANPSNPHIYVCVKSCPKEVNGKVTVDCHTTTQVKTCSSPDLIPYATKQIVTLCIPTSGKVWDTLKKIVNIGSLNEWFHDIGKTWPIIAASSVFALVLALLFVFLLRIAAGCMIWSGILVYLLGLIIGGGACFVKKDDYADQKNKYNGLYAAAILLWIFAGLSIILVLCLFKKIRLAIAVMKTAADFSRNVCTIFFVPLIMFFIFLIFFVFWLVVTTYLVSSGVEGKNLSSANPFGHFLYSKTNKGLIAFYVIGLIWVIEFLIALLQFIIAGSTCFWYFTSNKDEVHSPIRRSVGIALRYHVGTLAFGSLLLVIVWIIKFTMEFIHQKMKGAGSENPVISLVCKCCQCCIECFERFIRFLNKNAYIQCALTGENFCTSAKNAFFLITRNIARFGAVSIAGSIIILFGKLFICAGTSVICYFIITKSSEFSDIYSPIVPTLFFVIISLIIGSFFLSIYGIAIDAILQCYLIDEEIHQKKGSIAQNTPDTLKAFIDEHCQN